MGYSLGEKIKKGIFWTFLERIGTKLVQFILQLILARILVPNDYGLSALLLAFINIATILINSGLSSALIQKKSSESIDYSSVFYICFLFAITLYIILYILAPNIATFFDDQRISSLLRVISSTLIIGSFNSIQLAILQKRMLYKKLFLANSCAIAISATISIFLAFQGYGVWSIVIQYVINRVTSTLILMYLIRWFPRWEFSFKRVISLWDFGWKYMMTSILSTIVTDIYTATIGKCYTKSQLGVYDTGNKIPSTISETFTSSLGSVLFPAFSVLQDNKLKLKEYVQKSNKTSTFLMFPLMFAVAAMSESIVQIVLTEKWITAVPFLQMACILYAFYPIHIANVQAINAIGRSDVALKVEFQKKCVDLSLLAIMVHFSIYWVALGRVITSVISLWLNMRPNKPFLNYSFMEQIMDVLPALISSLVMATIMILISKYTDFNAWATLSIQLCVGTCFYLLCSWGINKQILLFYIKMLIK